MEKFTLGRAQPSWLREDDVPAGLVAPVGAGSKVQGGRGHRLAYSVRLPEDQRIFGSLPQMARGPNPSGHRRGQGRPLPHGLHADHHNDIRNDVGMAHSA